METIKCKKCGCEMSAMSEACPLCGTPTSTQFSSNNAIEESKETSTSYIPKCDLHNDCVCKSLEKAIAMAAGHKKQHPLENVYIYPDNTNTPLQPFFDNIGIVVGMVDLITNRPYIYSEIFDNDILLSLEDCESHASSLRNMFAKQDINNTDVGYTFVVLNVWENPQSQNQIDVELFLKEDSEYLILEIEKFNQIDSEAGGKLFFDTNLNIIKGTVKTLPVKGGLFEKKRIKKSNEVIVNAFYNLIEKASKYFE